MVLPSRKVGVPLSGGLDKEAHDYVLDPPRHERLTNLEHTEDGALVRRDELQSLASTGGSVEAIAGFEEQGLEQLTVLTDEGARVLYGDLDDDNAGLIAVTGDGPRSVDLRRYPIVRSSEGAAVAYSAAAAGYVCHVWTRGRDDDDGAIWVRIDDMETGAPIYGPAIVTGMDAKAIAAATYANQVQAMNAGVYVVASTETDAGFSRTAYFHVFGRAAAGSPTASDPIACKTFPVVNGSTTPGTTTTLAAYAWSVAAHADPSSSKVFVVGWDGTDWDVYEYDGSGSALSLSGSMSVSGLVSGDTCLAVCHGVTSDRLMAVFKDGGSVDYINVDVSATLSGGVASATLYTPAGSAPSSLGESAAGICETSTGFAVAYQGTDSSGDYLGVKVLRTDSSGNLTSSTGKERWNVTLHAQPFVDDDGDVMVPLCADATRARSVTGGAGGTNTRVTRKQAYLAQVDGNDLRRVCEYGQDAVLEMLHEQWLSVGKNASKRLSHSYRVRSGEAWGWPVMVSDVQAFSIHPSLTASIGGLYSAGYITADPGSQRVRVVYANGSVVAGSGYLAKVDGERFGEVMQIAPPSLSSLTNGSTTPEKLTWRMCWAWRDANGVLHRSAPSESVQTNGSLDPALTVAMPPWADWSSQGGIEPTDLWLEVYMSPIDPAGAGGTADGTHWRRAISASRNTSPHLTIGHLDAPKYAIRYTDIYQSASPWVSATVYMDVSEPGELQLYADEQLDHDPAPCPVDVAASRDRLWVIDAEDRQAVWYSVPLVAGQAPALSALLKQRVPTGAGDLNALGVIDDLVVFFGSSGIYALEALGGPDSTGTGAFPPLRRLSTERGCINPASVITTDIGLLFQARDGFWSISGAGEMAPIGRPVREELDGRTVRGSVVLSEKQQAVWLLDNDTALVLDLEGGAWSLHDYTAEDTSYTACGVHDGRLVLGTSDGQTWRADPALPLEGAADINVGLTTGWIKLAGLQGFKRCRKLGLLGRFRTGDTVTPDSDTHTSRYGDLTVSLWYDYDDDASPTTYTLSMTEGSGEKLDPFHWRIPLARQKCAAIKVGVDYDAPKVLGEPIPPFSLSAYPLRIELVGLALEVGVKRGIRKIGHGAGGTVT